MNNYIESHEFEAVMKFVDQDIKDEFNRRVKGADGIEYPMSHYVSFPALTAATIQLARVIREGFSRGFVVKE